GGDQHRCRACIHRTGEDPSCALHGIRSNRDILQDSPAECAAGDFRRTEDLDHLGRGGSRGRRVCRRRCRAWLSPSGREREHGYAAAVRRYYCADHPRGSAVPAGRAGGASLHPAPHHFRRQDDVVGRAHYCGGGASVSKRVVLMTRAASAPVAEKRTGASMVSPSIPPTPIPLSPPPAHTFPPLPPP